VQEDQELREKLVAVSRHLYERGLTFSTGGNCSIRSGDNFLISKNHTAFGRLTVADIILCDRTGMPLEEGKPSNEVGFHTTIYRVRSDIAAIIHVHPPFAIMLGAYRQGQRDDVLPICTYGAVTQVKKVPAVDYYRVGSSKLLDRIGEVARTAEHAIYLEKHGLITFAADLAMAGDIAEEFEQNARIFVMTQGRVPILTEKEVAELRDEGGKA
jgi:ribulose-5-phosphate 4-epimerase/fuculose-1-phosphate aldolase